MHILYYHQHFSTPDGSTGTRSYEMARRLIDRGHKVTMICGSYGGGKTGLTGSFKRGKRYGDVDGIHVIEFFLPYSNKDNFIKRSITFLRFALKSIGIALIKNYDLIFATSTPLTAGLPGIAAKWLRNKAFVFEVRDLWPELPREMGVITNPVVLNILDILEWLSYHSADACIGLSLGIVNGIKKRGIHADKITMIPNGCDLDLFNVENESDCFLDNKDTLTAVFTGAHGMANGLDAVLDAAEELIRRGRKDIKILFIGDGKLKPSLKKRAEQEYLKNCIFMDPVPKKQLAKLIKKIDIGLMILANVPAFYYGTSPNKFFDYISTGLPVLNNYPGWLTDMIKKHECGIAVPPENSVAFANALEYFADNRDELKIMGQNARVLAEKKFNRKKLADQFVNWLENVLR
ncbi:colanic acid biosynthesis glycosyl transferase WcaI [Candidatus Magnetomoraceae bacterium gMMP-15]